MLPPFVSSLTDSREWRADGTTVVACYHGDTGCGRHNGVCLLHGDTGRRTAHRRVPATIVLRRASHQPGAGIIPSFRLIVKLGFSTSAILRCQVCPIDTYYAETKPRREAMRAFVGTTTFHPSLAELTVVEPD